MATTTAEKRETRHVRVYEEMADKIGWIVELGDTTSAALLEEIAGRAVAKRFAKIKARVDAIKAAKAGKHIELGEAGA
jgi:hypothetical protein